MTKEQLIALLERTIAALRADDSFQGSIAYEVQPGALFNVNAAVRIGNSQGQGGMMVAQEWVNEVATEGNLPACRHPTTVAVFDAMSCTECGAFLEGKELK